MEHLVDLVKNGTRGAVLNSVMYVIFVQRGWYPDLKDENINFGITTFSTRSLFVTCTLNSALFMARMVYNATRSPHRCMVLREHYDRSDIFRSDKRMAWHNTQSKEDREADE